MGRNAHFVTNTPTSRAEVTHVSLKRKPSVFEGEASNTWFPYENWVGFWKEYCGNLGFSRWRVSHFVPNRCIQLRWSSTCISWKKTLWVRSRSIQHIGSCYNWGSFIKEYCLSIRVFILLKMPLFSWVEEAHVSLERNASMLEHETYNTLFPCENWVRFWKE
jgi:hypothetical protein